jgi:hypothetical protein
MGKYVYVYYGGSDAASGGTMEAWNAWFGQLGENIVDAGNQFAVGGQVVHQGGVMDVEGAAATGYTIVKAETLAEAIKLAKGCPLVDTPSGAVAVYEAMPM